GISVVGVFGVLLLGLSMTGILAHPRIFRDAFTFRLRRGARLTHADIHNRLSVWTSPFHIVIAFTGTMIALSVVGSYVVAQSSFDGDRHAVFDTVFGPEPEEDETPAALPAIARALDAMARDFPEVEPTHVVIHNPATAGQDLQVLARHPDRLIFAEYYMFTGDGTFTDTVGLADGTLGQQLAASVYTIHFGSYGGTPIKVVYAILGLALTFIITSGIRIHLLRRRQQGFRTAPLEPVWAGIVWGVPGLLAVTLVLALTAPGSVPYLPLVFWGGLVVIVAGILTGTLVPRRSPGVFSKDGS
ncbi:MAG: PepSY-associated TM helix domain-containing protein, partial [Sphingomonadales bacterium]